MKELIPILLEFIKSYLKLLSEEKPLLHYHPFYRITIGPTTTLSLPSRTLAYMLSIAPLRIGPNR